MKRRVSVFHLTIIGVFLTLGLIALALLLLRSQAFVTSESNAERSRRLESVADRLVLHLEESSRRLVTVSQLAGNRTIQSPVLCFPSARDRMGRFQCKLNPVTRSPLPAWRSLRIVFLEDERLHEYVIERENEINTPISCVNVTEKEIELSDRTRVLRTRSQTGSAVSMRILHKALAQFDCRPFDQEVFQLVLTEKDSAGEETRLSGPRNP